MGPPLHETLILKPRDRSIRDTNLWPDFLLKHVDVRDPNTGQLANLLLADAGGPVTVVGKLHTLPLDRLRYLKDKSHAFPVNLEVTNVGLFSYGQYDEGEIALWAAGEAGWFEIKPSRAYRVIFQEMVEAVKVLYFTADIYREQDRYKLKKLPAEDIFAQYASEPAHKCKDASEAARVFETHKRFLLTSMENGKEGISWKQTKIYQHLRRDESDRDSAPESATGVVTPPLRPPPAGKGKSTQRPNKGRLSLKGAERKESQDADDDDREEEEDAVEGAQEVATTETEIHLARNTSPSLLKRKNKRKEGGRTTRRQKHVPDIFDEVEDDSLPTPDDDISRPLPIVPTALAAALLKARKPVARSLVRIIEEPLLSYEPQGPGDTWTCTLDGCSHRVYGASSQESRELIREHYRGHAFSEQAQIDLVYKEERPYLPVGNLIKKIRELSAVQQQYQQGSIGGASVARSAEMLALGMGMGGRTALMPMVVGDLERVERKW